MNIAINARMLLKSRMEGISRFVYETSKRIVENHPDHHFYLFFDRPYDKKYIFGPNVTPIVVSPPSRHYLLWILWFEYRIPFYLKKYKIDVFYSGDGYLSLKTKVPTVLVTHDIAYEHFDHLLSKSLIKYFKKYSPLFHKKADKIFVVSSFVKEDIIKTYNLNPSKISIAYNAPSPLFRPIGLKRKNEILKKYTNGVPYFLYLGSINPRKNLNNLISAFELYKTKENTPEKLVLIGKFMGNVNILDQIKNSDFADDILILSNITNEVYDLMGAAEIFLYVSLFEGFGIPILEAYKAKIPVITSNVTSMPEVAGKGSLLVNPYNIDEIAEALIKLQTDELLKKKLISEMDRQLTLFNWDNSAEKIYQAITSLGPSLI